MSDPQANPTRASSRDIQRFCEALSPASASRFDEMSEIFDELRADTARMGVFPDVNNSFIFHELLIPATKYSRSGNRQFFDKMRVIIKERFPANFRPCRKTCTFETDNGLIVGLQAFDKLKYYTRLGETWKNRRSRVAFYAPDIDPDDVQFLKDAGHEVARNPEELAMLVEPTLNGSLVSNIREGAERAQKAGKGFKDFVDLFEAGKKAFEWIPAGARGIAIQSITLVMGCAVGIAGKEAVNIGKWLSTVEPGAALEYLREISPPFLMLAQEYLSTKKVVDEVSEKRTENAAKQAALLAASIKDPTHVNKRSAGVRR